VPFATSGCTYPSRGGGGEAIAHRGAEPP
jgi:hypothetical protein